MTATSKAAALGPSAAFGVAAGARSNRRAEFNRSLGIEEENAAAVTHLPVEDISLNPDNPRSELGDLTDLAGSLRDHGQKTAVSIMGRTAYLAANPERADALEPRARYVVIDGNSRLAAAREAGLKTIRVMVDDELGADSNQLLESALVANVHRKDLDPLDEARALQKLLEVHGNQEALAARLHRSQGWISQRLGLLSLTPALQERLVNGEESASNLRVVGRKPPEQQEAALERLKAEQEAAKAARRAARTHPRPVPAQPVKEEPAPTTAEPDYYDVISPAPTPVSAGPVGLVAKQPDVQLASKPAPVVPQPSSATDTAPPVQLRADDCVKLMDAARESLTAEQFSAFMQRYFRITSGVEEVAEHLGRGLPDNARRSLADILRDVADRLSTTS
ncbi:ParB/RepB/Spo0J family partition protein [Streptomyces cinereoruber]|uniref:ParB/RepB/Spo0J family partition protein n=1 Tax=Streptomyces cinereoruber TaxID=67260 RepID=UPI003642A1C5